MTTLKRRALYAGVALFILACAMWAYGDGYQLLSFAHAAQAKPATTRLYYFGASQKDMQRATGIKASAPYTEPRNPWPQNSNNYCFLALIQGMVNYADLKSHQPLRYPLKTDQGPASGNPDDEVPGQILYDMDHFMQPEDGSLPIKGSGLHRRPFTLANTAYDFGGDPRAHAVAIQYEAPANHFYHQYIYHTGVDAATFGIAKSLATYSDPVVAFVNHGEHSVLVAGVWATANPATDSSARIDSLVVYDPWNQGHGAYLGAAYYTRVSYDDWTHGSNHPDPFGGTSSWWALPYQSNNNIDPDPAIGIYQAGPGTSHPDAHHWINNYVTVQRDHHGDVSADFTYNEKGQVMLAP